VTQGINLRFPGVNVFTQYKKDLKMASENVMIVDSR
jgi:hypothetical protein